MKKILFILGFATLLFLIFGPYSGWMLTWVRLTTHGIDDLYCSYNGATYAIGEDRRAEDGCNVCTCGKNGWECTRIACAAGKDAGTISGELSPLDASSQTQRVCAVSLKDEYREYCVQVPKDARRYAIQVRPGSYRVYAAVAERKGYRAYWSAYVACGKKPECIDHSPLAVEVNTGTTADADPQDWVAALSIDAIKVSPSKREYMTYNYYPDSKFVVEGSGLSSVTLLATAYPPVDGAAAYPIGQAALVSEEPGLQVWTLPIKAGFQAGTVFAVGENEKGEITTSRTLRIVRPIDLE